MLLIYVPAGQVSLSFAGTLSSEFKSLKLTGCIDGSVKPMMEEMLISMLCYAEMPRLLRLHQADNVEYAATLAAAVPLVGPGQATFILRQSFNMYSS